MGKFLNFVHDDVVYCKYYEMVYILFRTEMRIPDVLNLGVEEEIDSLAFPYPIEVTQKMLECFEDEYVLQKQESVNLGLGCITDIGEELWMYSKNREYLIDEEDKQYLSVHLDEIKKRIDEIIKGNGN